MNSLVDQLNQLNPKVTVTIDNQTLINLGIMLAVVGGALLAISAILKSGK